MMATVEPAVAEKVVMDDVDNKDTSIDGKCHLID